MKPWLLSLPNRAFALALLLVLLASCRGQPVSNGQAGAGPSIPATAAPALPSSTATPAASTQPAPQQAPSQAAPLQRAPLPEIASPIVWYVRGEAPQDLAKVNDRLNELLAQRGFHARVEIRPVQWSAFERRMAEIKASKEPWDLVSLTGTGYLAWLKEDSLLPLAADPNPAAGQVENLLEKRAPGLWGSLPAGAWEGLRRAGGIYAVPNQDAWARPGGVSIRADVVSALGLRVELSQLHSYAGLTPLLAKIQAAVDGGTLKEAGIVDADQVRRVMGQADLLRPENAGYDPLWGPFAVRYNDPQAAPVNWYQTVEFRGLAALRRDWQEAGYLPDEPLTPDQVDAGYRSGSYLVEAGRPVWTGSALEQVQRYGYEWVDVPIAQSFLSNGEVLSSLTGVNARIGGDVERVQRVMLFLEWMHTDAQLYNLLAYGIEGEHWQWADRAKQVITLLPGSLYRPDYSTQLGDRTLSYALDLPGADLWQDARQANRQASVSPALGFVFDPRPVAAEAAAVRGLTPELVDPLANGQAKDVEKTVGGLEKALEDVGLGTIQKELERQWSDWKSNQKP